MADETPDTGKARETDVQESDPNADSASGLAGDLGVSSERVGPLRGGGEGTYGAEQAREPSDEDVSDVGEETERPDTDLPEHPFDPGSAAGHTHG